MSQIKSFEQLADAISKAGGKPKVLEALWDGDTDGWFLCLNLYTENRSFLKTTINRHFLGQVSGNENTDDAQDSLYPEAVFAKKLGEQAIERYGLEFYFPSPDHADDDCPAWSEKHLAIHCLDCNKLIIPTDSPYLPKDICYHCHLEREQNERIVADELYNEGFSLYLVNKDEYDHLGYATNLHDLNIYPFIRDMIRDQLNGAGVQQLTIEQPAITAIQEQAEQELQEQLKFYVKPVLTELQQRFTIFRTISWQGVDYLLTENRGDIHRKISGLFSFVEANKRAAENGLVYKLYSKKGITYRDDALLRFVRYVCKGTADMGSIRRKFEKLLSEFEVLKTIAKLEDAGCLKVNGDVVEITRTGMNIL